MRNQTYPQFLESLKDGDDPYMCGVCKGPAFIFAKRFYAVEVFKHCESCKTTTFWREVSMSLYNRNLDRYMRERRMVSSDELARILGKSVSYIRYLSYTGKIPYLKFGSRVIFEESRIPSIKMFMRLSGRNRGGPRRKGVTCLKVKKSRLGAKNSHKSVVKEMQERNRRLASELRQQRKLSNESLRDFEREKTTE